MRATRVRRDGPCEVPGCLNNRKKGALCSGHLWRKKHNHPDPRGRLQLRRSPGKRDPRRKHLGTLPAVLVDRLDRIARSRGITRILLVESTLQSQFAKEEE